MNTLTRDRTVGQIAAELPASVRVFEKHGIDFCCGGKVRSPKPARRLGFELGALLAEIDVATQAPAEDPTDWAKAPLPVRSMTSSTRTKPI
ncbi:MAG: protein of unknown function ScdA domain protein [Candidatus Solibacter sp.]|nr:protein of unknown function ScdA domain protein [Candidatus Solibacter sp.]